MTTSNNMILLQPQRAADQVARIDGQVAVVTGGGRGIGRAISLALAAAGARVAVIARTQEEIAETAKIIEQHAGYAQSFTADVTDATAVSVTMAKIEQSFGPVDLLVNNAALIGPIGPFSETDAVEWWRAMDVNLRGPLLCTRAVLPGMISRRRGRLVNIVSSAIPIPYFSGYGTSKTALVRFTEVVAAEVKSHGVSMFAFAPGTVRTAMSEYSLNSPQGQRWLPWFRRIFDEGLDLPAERPAQFVVKLASGEADTLSGRFLSAFDDLEALVRSIEEIETNNLHSLRVRRLGEQNPTLASIHAQAQRVPDFTLRVERSFAASCARLFRLWVEPEAIQKWFVHHAPVHWSHAPTD